MNKLTEPTRMKAHEETNLFSRTALPRIATMVSDYKVMRKAGNVKDAIKIRDQIKATIIAENLDAEQVWGTDWPKA
jgi:hypothetical protein